VKALALIVALIVILCVVYLIFQAVREMAAAAQAKLHDEWEVQDPTVLENGTTQIFLRRNKVIVPFDDPISGSLSEWEFQELLEDTKIRAQSRCDALNRRLSA
jgi:hypothetical protein